MIQIWKYYALILFAVHNDFYNGKFYNGYL